MITATFNAIQPRATAREAAGLTGIERARYTVSWYLNGVRPDAPRVARMTTRTGR